MVLEVCSIFPEEDIPVGLGNFDLIGFTDKDLKKQYIEKMQ